MFVGMKFDKYRKDISETVLLITKSASRIELCANLTEGGTTPSLGLLQVVKSLVSIPVYVMIRPRGGDFCYDDLEMDVMKKDIISMKQGGADGFVVGVLTPDGTVDQKKCQELLDEIHPLPATFHRAIDICKDIMESISTIVSLGFQRVLSSGGCLNAPEGASVLAEMIEKFGGKIIVMPGGGINSRNLEELLKCGAKEFHGSASECTESPMIYKHPHIHFSSSRENEFLVRRTSSEKVRTLVEMSKSFWNHHC